MPKRRVLHAKKYRVVLNDHLIYEVLDRMKLAPAQRGVVVRGLNAVRLALTRAHSNPDGFGVTIRELSKKERKPHARVFLYELLFVLDDPQAVADVLEHGGQFGPVFGAKTQQAVGSFAEAVCTEVERGFFRT